MKVGQYIYSKLTATAGVTALVSTRIYPIFLPQNATYPAIIYSVSNKPWDIQKDAKATRDEALVTFVYVADASQGNNAYASLDNIDLAVRNAIDFVSATAGSVEVSDCEYKDSEDGFNPENMTITRTATYRFITKN